MLGQGQGDCRMEEPRQSCHMRCQVQEDCDSSGEAILCEGSGKRVLSDSGF